MGEKGSEAGDADTLTPDQDAELQRAMDSRNSQLETELSNELKREADSRDALLRDPK